MEQKENNIETPESLRPVEAASLGFIERVRNLNESARANLPLEIRDKLSPLRLIGEGLGKSALGISLDLLEGATLASLTFGLSEIFPLTELAADYGTARIAEAITNRRLRPASKRWGYILSFVPLLGDIASPTLFDGLADILIGIKALTQPGMKNPQLQLNTN